MMNTPIHDFINEYCQKNSVRVHMPGHKGIGPLGFERYDITEINGADSLYEASGIIAESEKNASRLFGCNTFYSTEGSSHCIRAMLYMAKLCGCTKVLAGRNAHKTFLSAAALLDIEVEWLYPKHGESYLSGNIDIDSLDGILSQSQNDKCVVYITTPDYLGNITDIASIAGICKRHDAYLFVDNAHGAYLKFLPQSLHPIDLGADICCDSAHKTLPVLTGGAYLQISKKADRRFEASAKNALSLFGSTSPSYLILQSLDMANMYLSQGYKDRLAEFAHLVNKAKSLLTDNGFSLLGNEILKIVIDTKKHGYYGWEIADILEENNIVCEFYDRDHIVMMLNPENTKEEVGKLTDTLLSIEKKSEITEPTPELGIPKRAKSIREAVFAESEMIDANQSEGRILAQFNIACPPAVPIVVCGELINKSAIACFEYYGIKKVSVIK